ncbi:cobalamin biosynthesis protein CobW [Pseudomonas sp. HLS-6]|uniref:CobW family GTP-binding protein n=1 Tax=Pseudomonas sp. HLS-6 TaxID=2049589 RepID=UPI000C17E5DD|nr:CobW family GTP-binding protein [Pseudomonas sp. HLS-6]ATR85771.1 cobalamin biosynthesis protein CobW [Pseudomonas sp. HLS-6]
MLQNIPTHVIAGPLGAGKTSLIRHLMAHRPATERWAVLINEFGQIGLDAALLSTADDGIAMGEVAGGCLCCVNGAPFQVGLGRLLRKSRPDRLFIEPSGLGHPAQLLAQLRQPPWQGVLDVQPLVMVLDAQMLAGGQPLADSQQAALVEAGLLVLNKAEAVDSEKRVCITSRLPTVPCYWAEQGRLPLDELLKQSTAIVDKPAVDNSALPDGTAPLGALWTSPSEPICLHHQSTDGWSIGWRWHPSQLLDAQRIEGFLAGLVWRRAKLVIHSPEGWQSANALEGKPLVWQSSHWRRDSRIELIFAQPQDAEALQQGMAACLC